MKRQLTINTNGLRVSTTDTKYELGSGSITPETFDATSRKFFSLTISDKTDSVDSSIGPSSGSVMTLTSTTSTSVSTTTTTTTSTIAGTSTTTGTTSASLVASSGAREDDVIYQEEYAYVSPDSKTYSRVTHFGINSEAIDKGSLKDEVNFEGHVILEEGTVTYNQFASAPTTPTESVRSDTRTSQRLSGKEKASSDKSKGKDRQSDKSVIETSKKVSFHYLEKLLMRKATDYLLSQEHIEDGTKTVLVDMFARDLKKGSIIEKEGVEELEIHTVVLYRNPPKSSGLYPILVIDPSNTQYSWCLSNDNMKHSIDSSKCELHTCAKLQIYNPGKKKVGTGKDDYRDCIDIAVKLAFGLHGEGSITIDTLKNTGIILKDMDIIRALSNIHETNRSLDPVYKKALEEDPIRIGQDSDIDIVKGFWKISNTIRKEFYDSRNVVSGDFVDSFNERYLAAVRKGNVKDDRLKAFNELSDLSKELLKEMATEKHKSLDEYIEKVQAKHQSFSEKSEAQTDLIGDSSFKSSDELEAS